MINSLISKLKTEYSQLKNEKNNFYWSNDLADDCMQEQEGGFVTQ